MTSRMTAMPNAGRLLTKILTGIRTLSKPPLRYAANAPSVFPMIQPTMIAGNCRRHRPPDGRFEHIRHRSGILAERETKIARARHFSYRGRIVRAWVCWCQTVPHIAHRSFGSPVVIGHALRQPGDDGCHRIARHQARQDEIQQEGENKGD